MPRAPTWRLIYEAESGQRWRRRWRWKWSGGEKGGGMRRG
jgi:hypothetical protein